MSLRIFNTLTRAVSEFTPTEPGHVRMYVCGMTVYDLCHLGHARSMIAFDVVQRWLKASGLAVTYVRNITDIDDKIIKRALENGETIRNLREVAPTWYFNVPVGFEALARAMQTDDQLRRNFFSRLSSMMYAGAALSQPVQDARHIDPATARVIEHGSATQFVNWADFVDGGQHIQRRVEGEAQYIGHAGNIPPCDVCRQRLPGLTRPQGLPSLVSAWQRVNNASPRVGCH